jgi:metal-responsive CopG/Arc/MetJ family transcriptional regulator
MKTAISIPDHIFEEGEKAAKRLGLSRSKLYTQALESYLATRRDSYITEDLNRLYAHEASSVDPLLDHLQTHSIIREEW